MDYEQIFLKQGMECLQNNDLQGAFTNFLQSAGMGNATAMKYLADCYEKGEGTPVNLEASFRWMKASAEGENVDAYYPLALKYYKGEGIAVDYKAVLYWANQALQNPNIDPNEVQNLINEINNNPSDNRIDEGVDYYDAGMFEKAFEIFKEEAEKGDLVGMNNLSTCYNNGQGVPVNKEESFRWTKKAAENGYPDAFWVLALKYFLGEGTTIDLNKALYWANLALKNPNEDPNEVQSLINEINGIQSDNRVEEGITYYNSGNTEEAFEIFKEEAEKGNPFGMYNLSACYYNGHGVPMNKEESFRWIKKAAENGYPDAFWVLAIKYFLGEGTTIDLNKALYWANQALQNSNEDPDEVQSLINEINQKKNGDRIDEGIACCNAGKFEEAFEIFKEEAAKGNPIGMNNLSVCYANGEGTSENKEEAFKWMKASAENGFIGACFPLALKYFQGSGTNIDYEAALYWANQALQNPNIDQNEVQNLINEINNTPSNNRVDEGFDLCAEGRYDEAYVIFKEEAEKGNTTAMINLSVCYAKGEGTSVNKEESFKWMKEAADKGNAGAYYILALKYFKGSGIKINHEAALYWAKQALQNPNEDQNEVQNLINEINNTRSNSRIDEGLACYNAGKYEEAFEIFKEAADQGNPTGMNNLSVLYDRGLGVPVNKEQAFYWLKEAAVNGYTSDYYHLACKYSEGIGTPVNIEQALIWARKAAEVEDKNQIQAIHLIKELEERAKNDFSSKLPQSAIDDYQKGHQLFQSKQYNASIPLLERAGRAGHPFALYDIALAYYNGYGVQKNIAHSIEFFTAAAYRGDRRAIQSLAKDYNPAVYSADLYQWSLYAKYHRYDNCRDAYENIIKQRIEKMNAQGRGVEIGYVSNNAKEAMISAMKCYVEHPNVMLHNFYHPQHEGDATYYYLNAAAFGNVDGLCGYGVYYDEYGSKISTRDKYFKIAAYMGHSYAMYRLGQIYENTEPKVARECYRLAGKWGYGPAVTWCAYNGVSLDDK